MRINKVLILLCLFGCTSKFKEKPILQQYHSKKLIFLDIIQELQENYSTYYSHFTVKSADSSYLLNHKIVTQFDFCHETHIKDFFKKNNLVEIIVFKDTSIWFKESIGIIAKRLDEYLRIDRVPRTRKAVEQIMENMLS